MFKIKILVSFLLVVFTVQLKAEIYQCTDAAGLVNFQDTQCNESDLSVDKSDVINTINRSVSTNYKTSPLGKNLLKNSNFENKLLDWKVPIGVTWLPNKGVGASGVLSIQAEISPKDKYIHETQAEQCVLLNGGVEFILAAKFKLDKKVTGPLAEKVRLANRANIIWYESADCSIGGQFGGYIEPKNDYGWQSLKGRNLKPAFKAKAAKITLVQNGRYANGNKAYWDDVSFSASVVHEKSTQRSTKSSSKYTLSIGKNYIKNSKFKKDLSSWHAYRAKWSYKGSKSTGSAKVELATKGNSLGTGVLDQCINIGTNTQFDFGASMKKGRASTQSGSGRIRVSWNDEENCSGRVKTDNMVADVEDVNDWQHLQVHGLIAPDETKSVTIELIQSVAGKGKFILYWDDIYFKAVNAK